MHIPDGFLAPGVWGSLDLISGSFLIVGLRRVSVTLEEKAIPLMGVLASFVFAAQMINIPVGGGTSGHFLGGTLIGILVGPWAGLVVMSIVLVVQCFLLQDGGVAALGANIFNMGILGTFTSYFIYQGTFRAFSFKRRVFWSGFWSAWVSVILSALSCAMQLSFSKIVSWRMGLSVVGGVHAILGLVEGLVTGTVLEALSKARPDLLKREKV